ncbi:MAG: protein jag [Lachnospiraceae bacterium]|nr:protein jag [Lachnospiraceae bacterium]
MSDRINVSAKTVEEAVTKAMLELETTADKLEYEVVEKGSTGILGGLIGSKPAVIMAWKKKTVIEEGTEFLKKVFATMGMEVEIKVSYNEEEKIVSYDLEGTEMGVLIGKRGQTLDSLQHLVGLVINKHSEEYIRVKMDTENYRERRKETLEGLAKNIASKVKRTKHAVALEPMNPYERRIIHSTLQNDKYVYTKSEGEDPFRHVVIMLKKEAYPRTEGRKPYNKNFNKYRNSNSYSRSNSNNRYYYENKNEAETVEE